MATTHKVGGEVDAFCTKCKMPLAHTILAMVGSKIARVKCNTCGGDHAYRGTSAPASRATKPRAARTPKAEKVVLTAQDLLAGKDLSKAKPYSVKDTYRLDDLVHHPQFGDGVVTGVRGDKVDIAFRNAAKTLIHGRAGDGPKPHFTPPHRPSSGAADKPLHEGDALPPPEEPAVEEGDEGAEDESQA